jgi:hypothetical protein
MEGVIVLGTAGIALIGGVAGLVFGAVHRLRPPGRKGRPRAAGRSAPH